MELVDMRDLGSRAAMRVGSSPFRRTTSEQASYRLLRLIFISQNALILLLLLSHSDPLRWAHSGRDTLRTAFSVTGKVSVRLSSSEILGLARSPAMRRGLNRGFSTGFAGFRFKFRGVFLNLPALVHIRATPGIFLCLWQKVLSPCSTAPHGTRWRDRAQNHRLPGWGGGGKYVVCRHRHYCSSCSTPWGT